MQGSISSVAIGVAISFVVLVALNPDKLSSPFESLGLANLTADIRFDGAQKFAALCGWHKEQNGLYSVNITDAVGAEYIIDCPWPSRQYVRIPKSSVIIGIFGKGY
jgi:hypothetical protein